MGDPIAALTVDDLHSSQVDRTLRELQRMVKEHEDALNQLRESPAPSYPGPPTQAAKVSLDLMASAYNAVAQSAPILPHHGSVLSALLALRKTYYTSVESRAYAKSQLNSLDWARRQLDVERANLEDQKALQSALEKRVTSLQHGLESRKEKSPQQVAQERLDDLRQKKREYDRETSKLLKAVSKFIDDHLGVMLAAEGLGGPVVGDMMDIDTEDLGAGFNAQGKVKKAKANLDGDTRQRRIDELWGAEDDRQAPKGKRKRDQDRDEASAAGVEMRELTEQLLNSLTESAGDSSAAYVTIPRETAAVRFLVRSKVAQFHPKDATRLRLVDFGREIDD